MEDERFGKLVEEALALLPKEYAKRLDNVGIVVEDWPTPAQRMSLGLPPWVLLFGLYQGIPRTRRGGNYTMVLPDKITIFKGSILAVCNTEEEVKAQVRSTVIHEIGHHFGLSDADLNKKKLRN